MFLKLRTDRIIKYCPKTNLNVYAAAGATALSVLSNVKFAGTNKYLFIGTPGYENSEIVTYTSNTTNQTINCGALKFDHPVGTPIYLIQANQVKFNHATTIAGSYSIIGSAVDLDPESEFTILEDTSNSTGYSKAKWYNSGASADYGAFHEIIRYTGDDRKTRGFVKQVALDDVNATIDGVQITEDFLNNAVTEVDGRIRERKHNWKEETSELATAGVIGKTLYDVSSYIKDSVTIKSILFAYMGDHEITPVNRDIFQSRIGSAVKAALTVAVALVDVTITLDSSTDLEDAGDILIGGDTISYTANNRTTGVLSGVTGITAIHSIGDEVWQGAETGEPEVLTVVDGYLKVYPLINESKDAKLIKIVYSKVFTPITLDSDELGFPPHLYIDWLEYRISRRKGDKDFIDLLKIFDTDLMRATGKDISATEKRFTPNQVIYADSRRGTDTDINPRRLR
jgi:hypothetical protein